MNKKWITLLFSFSLCFCMSCSDSESDKKEEGKVEEAGNCLVQDGPSG